MSVPEWDKYCHLKEIEETTKDKKLQKIKRFEMLCLEMNEDKVAQGKHSCTIKKANCTFYNECFGGLWSLSC